MMAGSPQTIRSESFPSARAQNLVLSSHGYPSSCDAFRTKGRSHDRFNSNASHIGLDIHLGMGCAMTSASAQRDFYTYSFHQLAARDALVFKSIVGLLDGRTHGLWRHVEAGDTDLLVQGCANDGQIAARGEHGAKVVLTIGSNVVPANPRTLSLNLPLRASEVFERLEQAFILVSHAAATAQELPATLRVQLLRWPPSALLQHDPRLMRLAALLSSRPLTIAQLSELGHLPLDACRAFAQALIDAGVANGESVAVVTPVAPVNEAPKGLFARIRAHLGIATPRSEVPH